VNTVTASFKTIMGLMTEMCHQAKEKPGFRRACSNPCILCCRFVTAARKTSNRWTTSSRAWQDSGARQVECTKQAIDRRRAQEHRQPGEETGLVERTGEALLRSRSHDWSFCLATETASTFCCFFYHPWGIVTGKIPVCDNVHHAVIVGLLIHASVVVLGATDILFSSGGYR